MASVMIQKTIVGTVGRVYDLREVGSNGNKVLDFSVAVTPRKKVNDEWVDGETNWQTVTVWNRLAENVAASVKAGDRVVVIGREDLKPEYQKQDGTTAPARPIVVADYVGIELSYAPAESKRQPRNGGGGGNGGGYQQRPSQPAQQAAPAKPAEDDIFGGDGFDLDDDGPGPF